MTLRSEVYGNAIKMLDELPEGSVVLDSDGDAWQKFDIRWTSVARGTNTELMGSNSLAILTPLTVVHRGGIESPTGAERRDLIGAAGAAFKARGGAADWEEDAIARDLIIRWHLRGFEDGEKFGRRSVVPEPATTLHLTDSLKMVRETLCAVQNGAKGDRWREHSDRVGRIIAEIDRLRPLGPNGKHGDRHTATCGCADRPKPQGEPSDAKVEAAARRLFGATIDSMDRARELARVALTAPPLVACPHWVPGKITFRNGCTACAAGGAR